MTSHRRDDGTFFAWDSTMIKDAEKCARNFYYKHVEGWTAYQKSVHLVFGGHYAKALENFHKYKALGQSHDEALEAVVLEALCETWEKSGTRDGEEIGKPWNSFDTKKTRETLIRSIIWYVDYFQDEHTKTLRLANGKPAVEVSFKLEVDYGLIFCGHLDRVAAINEDNYILDNKTTGTTITTKYFDSFTPDSQMSMYTFAGKAIFDVPLRGVIIDAAQIDVGSTRFDRGFAYRTEEQLDEWYDGTMELINRINGYVLSSQHYPTPVETFPMNATACGNYGGCEFRHVCSKSPRVRNSFLRADFKQGWNWNPLIER